MSAKLSYLRCSLLTPVGVSVLMKLVLLLVVPVLYIDDRSKQWEHYKHGISSFKPQG